MRELTTIKARRARINAAMASRPITVDGRPMAAPPVQIDSADWRNAELARYHGLNPAKLPDLVPAEAPKKRGRPFGSKNKPKNIETLEPDRVVAVATGDQKPSVELEGPAKIQDLPRPTGGALSTSRTFDLTLTAGDLSAPHFPEVDAVCSQLVLLAAKWRFLIKQKNSIENRTRAYFRFYRFGFNPQTSKEEAAKIEKKVSALMADVRAGTSADDEAIMMVTATDLAIKPFLDPAERIAKEMGKLAETLPGAGFVRDTKGLGFVSFAKIVGQTGGLHLYATKAKLWKRLGLAVIAEAPGMNVRQQKRANVELAALHGYSPSRRSICWTMYDAMFKNQDAEYRAMYDRKKSEYLTRKDTGQVDDRGRPWTATRADNAARRYVEKRVIARLWAAWRVDCGIAREDTRRREAA